MATREERERDRLDRLAEVDAELTHLEQHIETTRREGWEEAVQDRSAEYIQGALRFASRLMKSKQMNLAFKYVQKCEAMTRGQPVYFMDSHLRLTLRAEVFTMLDDFEKARNTKQPADHPLVPTARLQRISSQLVHPDDRPKRSMSPGGNPFDRLYNYKPRPKTSPAATRLQPKPPPPQARARGGGGGHRTQSPKTRAKAGNSIMRPVRPRTATVGTKEAAEGEVQPVTAEAPADAAQDEAMDPANRLKLLDDYQMPNMIESEGEDDDVDEKKPAQGSDDERSQLGQWKAKAPRRERKTPRRGRPSPRPRPDRTPPLKKRSPPRRTGRKPQPPAAPDGKQDPDSTSPEPGEKSPRPAKAKSPRAGSEQGEQESSQFAATRDTSVHASDNGKPFDVEADDAMSGAVQLPPATSPKGSPAPEEGGGETPKRKKKGKSPRRATILDSNELPPVRGALDANTSMPAQSGAGAVAPTRAAPNRLAVARRKGKNAPTMPSGTAHLPSGAAQRRSVRRSMDPGSPRDGKKGAKGKKGKLNPYLVDNETLYSSLSGFSDEELMPDPSRRRSSALWLSAEKLRLQDKFLEARGVKRRQVLETVRDVIIPNPEGVDPVVEHHRVLYSAFARDHLPVEDHPPSNFKVPPPPRGNFATKVKAYIKQQHKLNGLDAKSPRKKKSSKEKKKETPKKRRPKKGILEQAKRDLEMRETGSDEGSAVLLGGHEGDDPHEDLLLTGIVEHDAEGEGLRAEDILAQMKTDGGVADRVTPCQDLPPAHYVDDGGSRQRALSVSGEEEDEEDEESFEEEDDEAVTDASHHEDADNDVVSRSTPPLGPRGLSRRSDASIVRAFRAGSTASSVRRRGTLAAGSDAEGLELLMESSRRWSQLLSSGEEEALPDSAQVSAEQCVDTEAYELGTGLAMLLPPSADADPTLIIDTSAGAPSHTPRVRRTSRRRRSGCARMLGALCTSGGQGLALLASSRRRPGSHSRARTRTASVASSHASSASSAHSLRSPRSPRSRRRLSPYRELPAPQEPLDSPYAFLHLLDGLKATPCADVVGIALLLRSTGVRVRVAGGWRPRSRLASAVAPDAADTLDVGDMPAGIVRWHTPLSAPQLADGADTVPSPRESQESHSEAGSLLPSPEASTHGRTASLDREVVMQIPADDTAPPQDRRKSLSPLPSPARRITLRSVAESAAELESEGGSCTDGLGDSAFSSRRHGFRVRHSLDGSEPEPTEDDVLEQAMNALCVRLCGAPIGVQRDSQVLVGWVEGGRRVRDDDAERAAEREARRVEFMRNRSARVIQREVRAMLRRWAEHTRAAKDTLDALFSVRNAAPQPDTVREGLRAAVATAPAADPPTWSRTMKYFTPRPPPPAAPVRDICVDGSAIPEAVEWHLRQTCFSRHAVAVPPLKP